jgi:cell fate regulator YaaT (PSP1 superfamily)
LQLKKNRIDEKSPDLKKILRRATEEDVEKMMESKAKEAQMLIRARAIARYLKLEMKIAQVEIQADGRKATYFYIADDRVDFRELIKLYAGEFKVKVEMRQIGARQEAGKVGGIGNCGRELCCSTWLTDFKSVNTQAARYQNLSINQTKLSGQCGRLKCCLNFELDTYVDALQHFPNDCDQLELARGRAFLVKKDIFRNLMWYTLSESNKQYPLSIDTVKRIKAQNREGIRPEELETVEVVTSKPKEVEPEYADLVGQISLRSLERTTRRRREKEKSKQQRQPEQRQGGGPQAPRGGGAPAGGNRPQQQQPPKQSAPGGPRPAGNQPRPGGGRPGRNRPPGGGGNRPNNPGGGAKN